MTVFIPTCNRAHYVTVAVQSALAQHFDRLEVLVLDDGSADDTLARLAGIADPRLRVERNARNLGIAATHNRGLALARGEYFAMLDDDEWAPPHRLARQVDYLQRHPGCAAVGSAYQIMDAAGGTAGRVRLNPARPEDVAAALLFRCAIHKPTVTARTATLQGYGFTASQRLFSDHDLWMRMARTQGLVNLPEVLGTYRKHSGQTTAAAALAQAEKQRICSQQLELLGVAATPDEALRHVWLAAHNLAPVDLLRDPEYLRWARAWLLRLLHANAGHRVYAPQALRGAIGTVWLRLCQRAAQARGLPVHGLREAGAALALPAALGLARAVWERRVLQPRLQRLAPLPA